MGADDIRSMLVQLDARPDDVELRRMAAEALDADGKHDDAIELLAPLINLTGHDDDAGLPCLCKKCLASAPRAAEASGMTFERSFVVVDTRVLHFWYLEELAGERENLRDSVADKLRQRLAYVKANRP